MTIGTSRKRTVLCDANGTPLATSPSPNGPVLLLRDKKTVEIAELVYTELLEFIEQRRSVLQLTGLEAVAQGDIIYGSGAQLWALLSIGTEGERLGVTSGKPAWSYLPGEGLSYSQVDTGEAMGVGTTINLTTPMTASFTLTEADDVWLMGVATASGTTATALASLTLFMDGVAASGAASQTLDTATGSYPCVVMQRIASLAAGSHTASLRFSNNAGTTTFSLRKLYVWRG